jgi:sec-independent protein translocase protein TatC
MRAISVPNMEMTLLDHLEELRWRILWSLVAILGIAVVALFFSDNILNILLLPSGGLRLKAFNIMDGFMIKFHISIYIGIAAAFPIWAFQIYRFFSPGLLEHERRLILPTLTFSSLLFVLGAAFGYYMLQEIIKVLVGIFPSQVDFLPAAQEYISFVLFFLLTCGLLFQLPILLTILIHLRVLSTELLQKQRRTAYFILFVIAELVTPVADPILAPMVVMGPLVILYEISILAGKRIESQRLKSDGIETAPAAIEIPIAFAPTTYATEPARYCTQCGAIPRTLDARYCEHCGKHLGEIGVLNEYEKPV